MKRDSDLDMRRAVMRRASDISIKIDQGDFLDLDLREDYETAVDCVMKCESIINTLQQELSSKDDRVTGLIEKVTQMSLERQSAKALEDERVAGLEERLVQMSLELASSKALEDQYRLCQKRIASLEAKNMQMSLELVSAKAIGEKYRLLERKLSADSKGHGIIDSNESCHHFQASKKHHEETATRPPAAEVNYCDPARYTRNAYLLSRRVTSPLIPQFMEDKCRKNPASAVSNCRSTVISSDDSIISDMSLDFGDLNATSDAFQNHHNNELRRRATTEAPHHNELRRRPGTGRTRALNILSSSSASLRSVVEDVLMNLKDETL